MVILHHHYFKIIITLALGLGSGIGMAECLRARTAPRTVLPFLSYVVVSKCTIPMRAMRLIVRMYLVQLLLSYKPSYWILLSLLKSDFPAVESDSSQVLVYKIALFVIYSRDIIL
jgi:hypothetical protein